MSWSRRYRMRSVAFTVNRSASTYGSGTYGEGTYGQEATDPLPNVEYTLTPLPGEWHTDPGWVFRKGDSGGVFRAQAIGVHSVLDLGPVESAALVIDRASVGERVTNAFPLTIDTDNDVISYEFLPDQLDEEGVYRVAVQFVFDSGRCMTVTPDDSLSLVIRGDS